MLRSTNGNLIANEQAVFPIITFVDRTGFHGLGTSFFINDRGAFLTAKHVFMDPNGEFVPRLFGVQTLDSGERILGRLSYIDCHPDADTARGMLGNVVNKDGALTIPPLAETLAITIDQVNINDRMETMAIRYRRLMTRG